MEWLEQVKTEAIRVFHVFLNEPGACLFVGSVFMLVSIICLRMLIAGLLEMHKSNSKMKKIRRQYGFWQKVFLVMAWRENEHATEFCKGLIIFHHIRIGLFLLSLLLTGLASVLPELSIVAASVWAVLLLVVDIPLLVFHAAMDRYPFKRYRNEYRFRKYHNTQDHDSLF